MGGGQKPKSYSAPHCAAPKTMLPMTLFPMSDPSVAGT
jgi:hypothetical protein